MHRLTGAVGWVVERARGMVIRGAPAEERRQTFLREFGQYPPHHEASKSERERFAREVVRPVLAQRAQAVQQAGSGSVDQSTREADEAFTRAYQAAVGLGLAEQGQAYQDYLGQRG